MIDLLDWLADWLSVVFALAAAEGAYDKEHCTRWEKVEDPVYVVVGHVAVPTETERCVEWDE